MLCLLSNDKVLDYINTEQGFNNPKANMKLEIQAGKLYTNVQAWRQKGENKKTIFSFHLGSVCFNVKASFQTVSCIFLYLVWTKKYKSNGKEFQS